MLCQNTQQNLGDSSFGDCKFLRCMAMGCVAKHDCFNLRFLQAIFSASQTNVFGLNMLYF